MNDFAEWKKPLGETGLSELEEFARDMNGKLLDLHGFNLSINESEQVAESAIKTLSGYSPQKVARLMVKHRRKNMGL